jgi:lactoylglutathione lyase
MVKDMNRAIAFYEGIGLKLKNRWGDHYAMISGAGVTLGIHPGGDDQSNSGTVSIGFTVDDIEAAATELDTLQVTHKKTEDGKSGIYCHFTDPDGTALYFVQPNW